MYRAILTTLRSTWTRMTSRWRTSIWRSSRGKRARTMRDPSCSRRISISSHRTPNISRISSKRSRSRSYSSSTSSQSTVDHRNRTHMHQVRPPALLAPFSLPLRRLCTLDQGRESASLQPALLQPRLGPRREYRGSTPGAEMLERRSGCDSSWRTSGRISSRPSMRRWMGETYSCSCRQVRDTSDFTARVVTHSTDSLLVVICRLQEEANRSATSCPQSFPAARPEASQWSYRLCSVSLSTR